jgi:hypothetical protein
MPKARHNYLLESSVDACIAAVEVYNKPDFKHREESFAILMLNAWELLLKARVVKANKGDLKSIEVWEPRDRKSGKGKTTKLYPKRNRSGNTTTISLLRALDVVRQYKTDNVDQACTENLHLLMEIRDNAVHFVNVSARLGQRVQEVGAASLRNYMRAAERWFGYDFTRYNFYLMPLAFHYPKEAEVAKFGAGKKQVKRLLDYFAKAERDNPSDDSHDFNVALRTKVKFVRTAESEAEAVRITTDPSAPALRIEEEDVLKRYPWDYGTLVKRLHARYSDFKQTARFFGRKRELESDARFCRVRYLNPKNPKGGKKAFYSPDILPGFDSHYTIRPAKVAMAGPAPGTATAAETTV